MNSATGNQRHFSRIPFRARARLSGAPGSTETQLRDISLKGALVDRLVGWEEAHGTPLTLDDRPGKVLGLSCASQLRRSSLEPVA